MKTMIPKFLKITLLFVVFAFFQTANAQAPQKMSYQAVFRNNSNALITSSPVGMRISILQGSETGSAVYVETQTGTTNSNGLISIEIGTGTPVSGTFAAINWTVGPYFIKTETDPAGGTSYSISGTNQLLSVPYALYAANGPVGATGPQGPAGANGLNGAVGATGPQGPAGANGLDGAVGATGLQGIQGLTGPAGANGLDGAVGATGPQGIQGLTGPAGANGLDGAVGATGPQGIQGIAGVDGTNGVGFTDGDKGDITIGATATTLTIDNNTVTPAKIAATGTASATTYLRGDGTWSTPAADTTTASNGLTLTGSNVALGGLLASATTIDQGEFPLAITSVAIAPNAFSVDGTTLSVDTFNNRVGIGTTTPNSSLTVNGSANNAVSYNAGAGTTIDFANSNLAYTSASAGAFTLTHLNDGGAYTLAVQGATSGTSTFTAAGFTVHHPVNNDVTVASTHTLYTFIVIGTNIYVSYVTGL